MPHPTAPPLPFDAVRDLLGVVRAAYAAAKDGGASHEELTRIAKVGRELSKALELAAEPEKRDAAWQIVDRAMLSVGDLVGPFVTTDALVRAARCRVETARVAARTR